MIFLSLMGKDIFPVNILNNFTKIPILICSAFHSGSMLKEIKEKKYQILSYALSDNNNHRIVLKQSGTRIIR